MKKDVSYRIRKLRESKDYSQENMAGELNITTSAYSKIERGITDPSIGRLEQIAKILDVAITYFFEEPTKQNKAEDANRTYGFATKGDIEELSNIIKQLKQELAQLKKEITPVKPAVVKKKK